MIFSMTSAWMTDEADCSVVLALLHQRRIQAIEMRYYRKILHISYKDHVTNEEVRAKISRQLDHTKIS